MNLNLLRTKFYPTHTIGQLYIETEFLCFTLEDVVREVVDQPVERWKIKGETAIPYGLYRLKFEDSPKFGPDTITLRDVPGFDYIRIHSGNTPNDTEGCIIVGYRLNDKTNFILPGTTRTALKDLKQVLKYEVENTIHIARSSNQKNNSITLKYHQT